MERDKQILAETEHDHNGTYAFQSLNYPTHFIGLKNSNEAWIIVGEESATELRIVPGLAGNGTISFEVAPNVYLRHRGY